MFTTIFRIGPLVLLEFACVIAAIAIYLFMDLPTCAYYTLAYFTLIFFLIEMIFSLKMMKTHTALRRQYLCVRAKESHCRYYCRMVWDNLNLLTVVLLLYYSLIVDGMSLSALSSNISNFHDKSGNDQCQFTLFALCLFTQLENTFNNNNDNTPGAEDIMVMWLLFAASTFLTTLICVSFSKEYYQYCSSIKANRKLVRQLGRINETLLDCHIYSFTSQMAPSQRLRDEVGVCSICLYELIQHRSQKHGQKVIRLRCSHMFHQQCLDKWLLVRDHCPYRCYQPK